MEAKKSYFKIVLNSHYLMPLINYISRQLGVVSPPILVIRNIIGAGPNDEQIMKNLIDRAKNSMKARETGAQAHGDRSDGRVDIILSLCPKDIKISRYLDYGCGDGSISEKLGARLGLSMAQVIGIDIFPSCPAQINYMTDTSSIPSESIDLITAMVSFHHIIPVEPVIKEVVRLLRPGGYFVIREHDFDGRDPNSPMLSFIHLIHIFNDIYRIGKCDIPGLVAGSCYRTSASWASLIFNAGLVYGAAQKYPGKNPQAIYHMSFYKPGQKNPNNV